MFFDHYPYTNFHNVNLDWVLQAVKAWGNMVEANDRAFKDLKEANEDFKRYVRNYLQDLDVSDEINAKLDRMLAEGTLTPYFAPYVKGYVESWLASNVTPTTPAVDKTLSISDAAADAAATGEKIVRASFLRTLDDPELYRVINKNHILPGYRIQSACHARGYFFVCGGSEAEDGSGFIAKMSDLDFKDADITYIQGLGHANDITYSNTDNYLYITTVGEGVEWGIVKINPDDFTDRTLITNCPYNTIGIQYVAGWMYILAPYRIYRTLNFETYDLVIENTNDILNKFGIPERGSQTLVRVQDNILGWVGTYMSEPEHRWHGFIVYFGSDRPITFELFPTYNAECQAGVWDGHSVYFICNGTTSPAYTILKTDLLNLKYHLLGTGKDINDYYGEGIYYLIGAAEMSNCPVSNEGLTLKVSRQGLLNTRQDIYTNSGRHLYRIKLFNPGTWSKWSEPASKISEIMEDLSALSLSVNMGVFGYSGFLGNAITLQFNDGTVMMIDSFSVNAWDEVKSDLTVRGITHLDYFMLTHWHNDHAGNISNLITDGYIDANTIVYLPQDLDVDATGALPSDWTAVVNNFNRVLPLITALGGTIIYPTEGQEVSIGGCELKFWNTDHSVFYPGGAYASTNYNDWSLCAYLFIGNTNVCFTGDLGPIGQQKMVDLNTMIKANLYTSTHHGWDNGTAENYFGLLPAWINRLNPDVVFSEDFSVHDTYILTPSSPMQSWCERNCVPNYRTAINGTMTVHLTPNGWSFGGAYSKYIREYDWGFDYHKKQLLTRIDACKEGLLKERYVVTSDTSSFDRLLCNAVIALRGSEYLTGYKYSFYIRVVDSDNSDAYLEIIASNFQYGVSGAVITTRYSNVIRYNKVNQQGTITIVGRTGTAKVVVELLTYTAVST